MRRGEGGRRGYCRDVKVDAETWGVLQRGGKKKLCTMILGSLGIHGMCSHLSAYLSGTHCQGQVLDHGHKKIMTWFEHLFIITDNYWMWRYMLIVTDRTNSFQPVIQLYRLNGHHI